jgi:hypothetical protein
MTEQMTLEWGVMFPSNGGIQWFRLEESARVFAASHTDEQAVIYNRWVTSPQVVSQ